MLIKALCDYYDYTDSKGENQTKDHLTEQNVHYMIMLTDDGEISEIVDIREEKEIMQKNKKTKIVLNPVIAKLPKRTQKSGIDVNIVEHRPLYIFGLNYDKGVFTPNDRTEKAKKSHLCFSEANLDFFSDLKSDIAKAYCLFIQNWEPEEQCENPFLLELGKNYSNSYFTFGLSGHPESPLHMNTELLDKFQKKYEVKAKEENDTADMLMCPIEGQLLPTARIHNKISGFRGGNSTGCVLVGFKESAFESYGKTQAFNSGISITAMNKYTSTLNKLISDKRHRIFLDDMTVVFFAMSNNDENECDIFSYLMTGDQVDKLNNNLE
ncbi:MAG: hypothetical protein GX896_04690, partial [Clostridiales bacterium]|nr:hypothetical protein [Clostridiales bacterium]